MSLIIKIILCFFIGYELYVIFARKHPAVSVKYHLMEEDHEVRPMSLGFDLAIQVLSRNIGVPGVQNVERFTTQEGYYQVDSIDPQMGQVEAEYVTVKDH
jgi:hypothetical protein